MTDCFLADCEAIQHPSALYLHPDALTYNFGPEHPMQPLRLRALVDLLTLSGLFGPGKEIREAAPATAAQLRLAHSVQYLSVVERLSSADELVTNDLDNLARAAGLGPGDTPAFTGMHRASAAIVGSTLAAVRDVLSGEIAHGFSPAGGLHHAMRERASGFCIYNDVVAGIAYAVQAGVARVLYIDFDAHHGDGVQAAFYDDRRVMTVSLHENGRYLFPGTGSVDEVGAGAGRGYTVNVPVAPFTQDESWLEIVHTLLPAICASFQPDLIVSQHGVDGHAWDPLTHLALTSAAFTDQTKFVHTLAHQYCRGRWVATGGGGYQPLLVVPRAWGALWAEMTGSSSLDRVPAAWLDRWSPQSPDPLPDLFTDGDSARPSIPRRAEIEQENRHTLARVQRLRALQ